MSRERKRERGGRDTQQRVHKREEGGGRGREREGGGETDNIECTRGRRGVGEEDRVRES